MKIIYRERGKGKTTELIKMADKKNGYIVCRRSMVYPISKMAREMKCNINYPLSYNEFLDRRYHPPGIGKFYIDDVDALLVELSLCPIEAITISKEEKEPDYLSELRRE